MSKSKKYFFMFSFIEWNSIFKEKESEKIVIFLRPRLFSFIFWLRLFKVQNVTLKKKPTATKTRKILTARRKIKSYKHCKLFHWSIVRSRQSFLKNWLTDRHESVDISDDKEAAGCKYWIINRHHLLTLCLSFCLLKKWVVYVCMRLCMYLFDRVRFLCVLRQKINVCENMCARVIESFLCVLI